MNYGQKKKEVEEQLPMIQLLDNLPVLEVPENLF